MLSQPVTFCLLSYVQVISLKRLGAFLKRQYFFTICCDLFERYQAEKAKNLHLHFLLGIKFIWQKSVVIQVSARCEWILRNLFPSHFQYHILFPFFVWHLCYILSEPLWIFIHGKRAFSSLDFCSFHARDKIGRNKIEY